MGIRKHSLPGLIIRKQSLPQIIPPGNQVYRSTCIVMACFCSSSLTPCPPPSSPHFPILSDYLGSSVKQEAPLKNYGVRSGENTEMCACLYCPGRHPSGPWAVPPGLRLRASPADSGVWPPGPLPTAFAQSFLERSVKLALPRTPMTASLIFAFLQYPE